jgi:hypothetical protein
MIVFGVAALPSMTLLHGIGIGIAIFFGIKAVVTQREKTMEKQVGEGYRAECGEKIQPGKCPPCDESKFQK